MRSLFVTATLAALLGATPVVAQQTAPQPDGTARNDATAALPEIAPPEGFAKADVVLTTENLQGAEVYDATGEEIGEVHGLVFANGDTAWREDDDGSDAASMPDAGTADTAMDGDPDNGDATETSPGDSDAADGDTMDSATGTDPATADPAAGYGTDGSAAAPDATNTVESATASPEQTAPGTDSDSTNVATGTDTGDSERIEGVAPASDAEAPADTAAATDLTPAGISHAIIDIGGFLGMGEHRVAVPIEDLVTYSRDAELRIYLPWTREQLEALPEFDEDGPMPAVQ